MNVEQVLSSRVNCNPLRKVTNTEYRKHGIGFTVMCSLECGHTVWRPGRKVGKFARCPGCAESPTRTPNDGMKVRNSD